jgi:arylsulfatase A-like enzyme
MDLISEAGRGDGSMVFVTSDHGEEFYEHGRWGHGKSLYDEVVRVPLVMVAPGVEAGSIQDEAAMLVDVLPTVAAAVGVPIDPRWQGANLLADIPERSVYAELIREGGFSTYMVYRDGRKYVEITRAVGAQSEVEFFDLVDDPGENGSLYSYDARTWSTRLEDIRWQALEASVARDEGAELDPGAVERLKALGYVN